MSTARRAHSVWFRSMKHAWMPCSRMSIELRGGGAIALDCPDSHILKAIEPLPQSSTYAERDSQRERERERDRETERERERVSE